MRALKLFEKIAGRQKERQENHEADFKKLVIQIADGQEPDVEWTDEVLAVNGQSVQDLQDAVERLQKRRDLRKLVSEQPKLEKDIQRIEGEIAAANRVFEEADKKHDEIVDPLVYQIRQSKQRIREAIDARQELWKTCEDENLCQQLAELSPQLSDFERRLSKTETEASNCRHQEAYEREQVKLSTRQPNRDHHKEESARYAKEAKELEAELPDLRRKVKDLQRQDKAIREQMLKA